MASCVCGSRYDLSALREHARLLIACVGDAGSAPGGSPSKHLRNGLRDILLTARPDRKTDECQSVEIAGAPEGNSNPWPLPSEGHVVVVFQRLTRHFTVISGSD